MTANPAPASEPAPAAQTESSHGADAATSGSVADALREAVHLGLPSTIADLSALARIPSVSWDGFDPAEVLRSAKAVKGLLDGLGIFDSVRISSAPIGAALSGADAVGGIDERPHGQPAVLATRAARNGKPTVLLYAHHDVQPPGDESQWRTPPFQPTLHEGRLYGRGTADDKAGIMAHVGAIRALVEVLGEDFDLGLAVFIEGEEEFGSRSFKNFLQQHRSELAADAIVVADSGNWDADTPALTVGLRGNVTFKLRVETLDHALHSGMFGGAVPDAMLAATRLLATLHDADGAVAVEGMSSHEQQTPEYSETQLRDESGLLEGVQPVGRGSLLSRIWAQPAITVTGIDAPSVQHASNTLLPSVTVKVSARVAPGQSAASAYEALERHLRAHAPFGSRLEFSDVDLGDPFLVDTEGPAVAAAKQAMHDAWGRPAVEMGVGGSIPFIADLVTMFPDAEILVTGVEDPDSRAHAPDESLHLGVFHRAVLTEAYLLAALNSRA
ncbi:dipeptidase [Ruicaihuangia caeni]|uniref:Dipeptidase n=1 Tax=Ruicaihuangia caeni TaxID=3042517 RepID=A0AAW6T3A1_9MICO|nr:dipeptidase [Klugiella sp. YN-L-19]MDI2098227.1 dipeptidase [Klugiella sp. YN-L-19]